MNLINKRAEKRAYYLPKVERIIIDNEISLALESEPPTFESRNVSTQTEHFNNDIFKS